MSANAIRTLFKATATATGGRNGRAESGGGSFSADFSVPNEMGGPGKANATTPEDLFAAGYAASFGSALDYVATLQKADASKASVTVTVLIGPRQGGGFGLAVKIHVEDKNLPRSTLEALAKQAHERVCAYSHATRGNVDVKLTVTGA